MNEAEKYNEEITDYLFGDMSDPEKESFEAKIEQDKNLALEVERQRGILKQLKGTLRYKAAIEDPDFEEFNQMATEVLRKRAGDKEQTIDQEKDQKNIWYYIGVIAAVAIITLLVRNFSPFVSSQKIYKMYSSSYSFDPAKEMERYGDQAINIVEYMSGNYSNVIENLSEKMEAGELNSESILILGLAYMAEEDYGSAIEVFNSQLNSGNVLQANVKWYLGLSYLRLKQYSQAETIFDELSSTDNQYSSKAARLKRMISKLRK